MCSMVVSILCRIWHIASPAHLTNAADDVPWCHDGIHVCRLETKVI